MSLRSLTQAGSNYADDDDALRAVREVLDEYYSDAKIRKLMWNITTNGCESLNADLIALFPKRLYC